MVVVFGTARVGPQLRQLYVSAPARDEGAMPSTPPSPSATALFGRRVRALRGLRRLTQDALGDRAGVSSKLVGQIERGKGTPTLEVILAPGRGLAATQRSCCASRKSAPRAASKTQPVGSRRPNKSPDT